MALIVESSTASSCSTVLRNRFDKDYCPSFKSNFPSIRTPKYPRPLRTAKKSLRSVSLAAVESCFEILEAVSSHSRAPGDGVAQAGHLLHAVLLAPAPPRPLLAGFLHLEHEAAGLDHVEEHGAHHVGRARLGLAEARAEPEGGRERVWIKA